MHFAHATAVVRLIETDSTNDLARTIPAGTEGLAHDDSAPTVKPGRSFGFPLPFDPIRLVAGVMTRWPFLLIGLIIFGAIGLALGIKSTKATYTITSQLIKRRVPQTVQTSETGNAYRPADLNDATLLATLLAPEAVERAAERCKNGRTADELRSRIEASQLEGTDIYYITYHSPISPDDAVEFTNIWADEINTYTRRLQQSEAHEVRLILQKEVADFERQLEEVNRQILLFCKEKEYLGGDSQVAAALGKLGQIDLQLENARTTIKAKTAQIAHNTELIRRQSPVGMQLKVAQEELANLRSTYTDVNPLVQAKLESIDYLNKQNQELMEKGNSEMEVYTGTPLGNQLFLDILNLTNQITEAKQQVESLEILQRDMNERVNRFPAIVSSYNALLHKRNSISTGLGLMGNRLKEAEIFSSGAPGYWQVFQAPVLRDVTRSSLVKKPALLGVAGGLAGAGMATALTLLFTQRSSRRSILECCSAARAPLVCCVPTTYEKDARAAVDDFWMTRLYPRLNQYQSLLYWTPAIEAADERRLWALLASTVFADTGKPILFRDLTPDHLWQGRELPEGLVWQTEEQAQPTTDCCATFLRASHLPSGKAREEFMQVKHWFFVVEGQKSSLRRARRIRPVTDSYLPPCTGTLAWMERPNSPIREVADLVSTFIAQHFSK